jgi:hypothetical protein
MNRENPESPGEDRPSSAAEREPQGSAEPTGAEAPLPDPVALVERMVAAEEWPKPELLEQILQAGDAAVEPLIALLRTDPHGWPEDAPVSHAIGLLSILRPPVAIPELASIIKRYDDEVVEDAGHALGDFGIPGFEALLDLCRDLSITGKRRRLVDYAAISAAAGNPSLRSRLAEVFRSNLADLIEQARAEIQQLEEDERVLEDLREPRSKELHSLQLANDETAGESAGAALGGDVAGQEEAASVDEDEGNGNEEDFEDEDEKLPGAAGEISCLIEDLADLGDPLARELIDTAFEQGLVDRSEIDEEYVDELYATKEEVRSEPLDWLSYYRASYEGHLREQAARQRSPGDFEEESAPLTLEVDRLEYGGEGADKPPMMQATAPIRNLSQKLGRNDPCWCGSGKKYKKCHLGKDSLT